MSTTETTQSAEVSHDLVTAKLATSAARAESLLDSINRRIAKFHTDLAAEQAEAQADVSAAAAAYQAHEASYTGWSRFFLVADGHLHRSMQCTTCYASTVFSWLPELSGLTEADAVAAYGEILCSICFPSAPVAWTNGESNAKKADRAEREAAKAERAAKKLAKALLPDGSTLRLSGRYGERLTSLASAKTWLTDAASWNRGRQPADFHPSYPAADVTLVAEAVAAKLGTTADVELAAAAKRAAKRDGV